MLFQNESLGKRNVVLVKRIEPNFIICWYNGKLELYCQLTSHQSRRFRNIGKRYDAANLCLPDERVKTDEYVPIVPCVFFDSQGKGYAKLATDKSVKRLEKLVHSIKCLRHTMKYYPFLKSMFISYETMRISSCNIAGDSNSALSVCGDDRNTAVNLHHEIWGDFEFSVYMSLPNHMVILGDERKGLFYKMNEAESRFFHNASYYIETGGMKDFNDEREWDEYIPHVADVSFDDNGIGYLNLSTPASEPEHTMEYLIFQANALAEFEQLIKTNQLKLAVFSYALVDKV